MSKANVKPSEAAMKRAQHAPDTKWHKPTPKRIHPYASQEPNHRPKLNVKVPGNS